MAEVMGLELPKGKSLPLLIGGGVILGAFLLARRGAAPAAAPAATGPVYVGDGGAGAAEFYAIQAQAATDLEALAAGNRLAEKELELGFSLERQRLQADRDRGRLQDAALLRQEAAAERSETRGFDLERERITRSFDLEREITNRGYELDRYEQETGRMAQDPTTGRLCVPWARYTGRTRKDLQKQSKNGKVLLQPTLDGVCVTPTGQGFQGHNPIVSSSSSSGLFSSGSRTKGPAGSFDPGMVQAPATGFEQLLGGFLSLAPFILGGGAGPGYGGYGTPPFNPGWPSGGYFPQWSAYPTTRRR